METKPANAIDQYQSDANKTCSPLDEHQLFRLAQCSHAIGYMADIARPALALADVIKKYVFYGREPGQKIPHFIAEPSDEMRNITAASLSTLQARVDLLHGILGLLTEGEEVLTAAKMIAHGDPPDGVDYNKMMANMKEEAGDFLWYVALIARALGIPLSDITEANIRKLNKVRFKNATYTNEAANNRNIAAEQAALEDDVVDAEVADTYPDRLDPEDN